MIRLLFLQLRLFLTVNVVFSCLRAFVQNYIDFLVFEKKEIIFSGGGGGVDHDKVARNLKGY